MLIAGTRKCPSCAKAIDANAIRCIHCGRALDSNPYEIVLDDFKFGIAFNGEVIVHGIEFKEAKETVSILNSVKKIEAG